MTDSNINTIREAIREGARPSVEEAQALERELGYRESECNQLHRDWDAEVEGKLELRRRFGALATEGFTDFVERLYNENQRMRASMEERREWTEPGERRDTGKTLNCSHRDCLRNPEDCLRNSEDCLRISENRERAKQLSADRAQMIVFVEQNLTPPELQTLRRDPLFTDVVSAIFLRVKGARITDNLLSYYKLSIAPAAIIVYRDSAYPLAKLPATFSELRQMLIDLDAYSLADLIPT